MSAHRGIRRRIYSEMLAWDELLSADVLELLSRYSLSLVVAVRPGDMDVLARLLDKTHARGIGACVWPMLSDEEGRWLSCANVRAFERFLEALWESVLSRWPRSMGLLIDLEPPISDVRSFLSGTVLPRMKRSRESRDAEDARDVLSRMLRRFSVRGLEIMGALMPNILFDTDARPVWQSLMGTPVPAGDFDVLSPMLYTSMMEGYSHGLLGRRDVLALLYLLARRAREQWHERASVSLGVVSTGALGDEPVYRDPSELSADVAAVLAAGIRDIALFDLAGVLSRGPATAWLSAFTRTPRTPILAAPHTWRASLLHGLAKKLTTAIAPIVPVKKSP